MQNYDPLDILFMVTSHHEKKAT